MAVGSGARTWDGPEPRVGALFGHGFDVVKRDLGALVTVTLVAFILDLPANVPLGSGDSAVVVGALSGAYSLLVAVPLSYGYYWVAYRASAGERTGPLDLFAAFKHFLSVVASALLLIVIVGVGLALLIVPGIFFALRLMLVPFLVLVEGRGPVEALSVSYARTRGHTGMLFLFGLAALGVAVLGVLALFVGLLVAVPIIFVSMAGLYRALSVRPDATGSEPGTPPDGQTPPWESVSHQE